MQTNPRKTLQKFMKQICEQKQQKNLRKKSYETNHTEDFFSTPEHFEMLIKICTVAQI